LADANPESPGSAPQGRLWPNHAAPAPGLVATLPALAFAAIGSEVAEGDIRGFDVLRSQRASAVLLAISASARLLGASRAAQRGQNP